MIIIAPSHNRLLIQERRTNRDVQARVVVLTPELASREIEKRWWSRLPVSIDRSSREVDQSWPWSKQALVIRDQPEQTLFGYALVTPKADKTIEVQGAMTGNLDAVSPSEPGERALYLHWVATHPLNRLSLVGNLARFRNVGRSLVLRALMESRDAGFGGRTFLQPVAQTEKFYEKLKFRLVQDSQKNRRYRYYEISPGEAQGLLREEGWI